MGTGIKDKYNIAINGTGYILMGSPDSPGYQRKTITSQIDRFSISDLEYSDFSGSGLFYVAQTDWSAGFKDTKKWEDDGKYFYSTNIDAYSEQGLIKLEKDLAIENDFTEEVWCGGSFEVDGNVYEYVGCGQNASSYPTVYTNDGGSWNEIAGTSLGTNQNGVCQLLGHKGKLWAFTVGAGSTHVVEYWDGSSWTDVSNNLRSAVTMANISSSRCACELAGVLYVTVDNFINNLLSIATTADEGATFTEVVHHNLDGLLVGITPYNGKIYYLLYNHPTCDLRVYDPILNEDSSVEKFVGISLSFFSSGNRNLIVYKGKLVLSFNNSIYEFDGNTVYKIWDVDSTKDSIGDYAVGYTYYGGVIHDDLLHFGNLIYDGEVFYNWKRPYGDTDYTFYPIFEDENGRIYGTDANDDSILYDEATTYKSTFDNNFIILNEMSPVVSIDKLLYGCTIMFDPMASNQQIKIYYSIDNMSTWTQVGSTMTSSSEGTGTKREFVIPGNIIFNKIWWKINLDGTATTPKILDFIMSYKPLPDYRNQWSLKLDCTDDIGLLNGSKEADRGSDIYSKLWNERAIKQKVIFEDLDYFECSLVSAMSSTSTSALVDTTKRMPKKGRIRAVSGSVSEEMTYTSTTTNKILGISRGQRGTRARSYLANQVIKNDYDVLIDEIQSQSTFSDENKTEYISQVRLIEL